MARSGLKSTALAAAAGLFLCAPLAHALNVTEVFDGSYFNPAQSGRGVLVDVISPGGEYLDCFFLPLPKRVGLHGLGRHPLTISGRTMLALEILEDGQLEVVKYEIIDPAP